MNIYEQKYKWKIGLFVFAIIIVSISLFYTNILAGKLAEEERKKTELWALATKEMSFFGQKMMADIERMEERFLAAQLAAEQAILAGGGNDTLENYGQIEGDFEQQLSIQDFGNNDCPTTTLGEIIKANNTIPVIVIDANGKYYTHRNTDPKCDKDTAMLEKMALDMPYDPIELNLGETFGAGFNEKSKLYVHYSDSSLLKQLKLYPFFQLGIFALFLLVSYAAFNTARRAEQNQVWLGMAKETAHQLGTPLSSLVAWIEILKEDEDSEQARMVGHEIGKDIGRLKLIADRFSKIGSAPKLVDTNLTESVNKTVEYIRRRASGRVKVLFEKQEKAPIITKLNSILFDWVIENLLKNALDAMDGQGEIKVILGKEKDKILITVSDTGKGIPKSKFKTVFEPGFSTKKRGWGLGLSLSKRIVERYHSGKIFVDKSAIGQGTTFKILLPIETITS